MELTKLKNLAKTVRDFELFNHAATTGLRACLQATGIHGDGLIRRFRRVGPSSVRLPNGRVMRFRCYPDDGISNPLWWRGWSSYEPETVELFFHLAAQAKVTFDIGAYIGLYALIAAHANPNGRVFAFEPVQSVYDRLRGNIDLNQMETLTCVCAAVGETEEITELFSSVDFPTISGFSHDFVNSWGAVTQQRVPVIRIDRFAEREGLDRVDLVKIDTETSEPQVLSGMIGILRRDRPAIICEVHQDAGTEDAIEDMLGPLGYSYYILTSGGPQKRDRIHGQKEWTNHLFINSESEGQVGHDLIGTLLERSTIDHA